MLSWGEACLRSASFFGSGRNIPVCSHRAAVSILSLQKLNPCRWKCFLMGIQGTAALKSLSKLNRSVRTETIPHGEVQMTDLMKS